MLSSRGDSLDWGEPRVAAPVGPRTDGSNPAAVPSDRG